jgi:hypothetical protein
MEKQKLPVTFNDFEDLTEGLTPGAVDLFKKSVSTTIHARNLIYEQKRDALAAMAAASMPYPPMSPAAAEWLRSGILCILAKVPRTIIHVTSRPITSTCCKKAVPFWSCRRPAT